MDDVTFTHEELKLLHGVMTMLITPDLRVVALVCGNAHPHTRITPGPEMLALFNKVDAALEASA